MMFLVEAADTVKRYSAFPKTITSNPKSHFVFGVLPIAHILIFFAQAAVVETAGLRGIPRKPPRAKKPPMI